MTLTFITKLYGNKTFDAVTELHDKTDHYVIKYYTPFSYLETFSIHKDEIVEINIEK